MNPTLDFELKPTVVHRPFQASRAHRRSRLVCTCKPLCQDWYCLIRLFSPKQPSPYRYPKGLQIFVTNIAHQHTQDVKEEFFVVLLSLPSASCVLMERWRSNRPGR